MSGAAVARVTDPIEHSPGLLGFAVGAVVGAVAVVAIAVATAATGGAALIALAAAGAVGGGIVGELLARAFGSNITTGALSQGYEDVHVNNLHMVAVGKKCEPCWIPIVFPHGETVVVEGSGTVLVHCAPVTRVGDQLLCDAIVGAGSPNVFVGGPKHRVKGTEKGWLDFLLPRLGFVMTATTIAIYPASALGSLAAVGLYQADYGTYKATNEWVGKQLGVDPSHAAIGIELLLGAAGGAAAGKLPRVGSWSATSSVARSQSWQRYLARKAAEGKTPWSYQRWSQNWTHLVGKEGVRPGVTRNQRLNNLMTSLMSAGPLEFGTPDLLGLLNSAFQKAIEAKPPEGHDCDASWHAPAPG
jgi:uncharacterized Zn-binding protein involved in type VI secretion